METAFFIVCLLAATAIVIIAIFAIGKLDKDNKCPEWLAGVIGFILVAGAIYGATWFYDAYREYILDQEHARQSENCIRHAKTEEQCQFFWDMLNED